MELRTKAENFFVDYDSVKKYHNVASADFATQEIKKLMHYLAQNTECVHTSFHQRLRRSEKSIPFIPFKDYMEKGTCFEYKVIGNTLFRLAVRIEGEYDEDFISVFQPQWNSKNQLEVVIITSYANNRYDSHKTLKKKEYVI